MLTIAENPATRYVLAPVYSPADKAEEQDVEDAAQGVLLKSIGAEQGLAAYRGATRIGQIVDWCVWPQAATLSASDGVRKASVELPPKTAFVGIKLTPQAWRDHLGGKLRMEDVKFVPVPAKPVKKAILGGQDEHAGKQPLVNPDDGAPLAPYGTPEVDAAPIEAQAQALANTFHALDPKSLHAHLRRVPLATLHAAAAHPAVTAHPKMQASILAAAADHALPPHKVILDSLSPAGALDAAYTSVPDARSNSHLRDAYAGDQTGRSIDTAAPVAEAIDNNPIYAPAVTARYAGGFKLPKRRGR